jgi:hypothetical protein
MSPDARLREEYGSVKSALLHYAGMNMNKAQTAAAMGIAVKTLRERASRFNVQFPDGYATRDTSLQSEVASDRMRRGNQTGTMGGRQRWKVRA